MSRVPLTTDHDDWIVVTETDEHISSAEIEPRLAQRLMAYAQRRLAGGSGSDRLAAHGVAQALLRSGYAPGYLTAEYRQALSASDAAALGDIDLVDCVVLPATDRRGRLAAICAWRLAGPVATWVATIPVQDGSIGILGRRVAVVAQEIVLVDRLGDLGASLAAGERHVLLLRPDLPVELQLGALITEEGPRTARLAVRGDVARVRAACHAAGIAIIEPPATGAPWSLADYDGGYHRATFVTTGLTAVIDTPWHGAELLGVAIHHAGGRSYRDRLDLTSQRQRETGARIAAGTLQVDLLVVEALLTAGLYERLITIEASGGRDGQPPLALPAAAVAPTAPTGEQPGHPDPIARFVADLEVLGWIGDRRAKVVTLLALAGRQLAQPPWVVLRGSRPQTLAITLLLEELLTADRCVHIGGAIERSLSHYGQEGLQHRVLLIDDAGALRPPLVNALHLLAARGAVAVPLAAPGTPAAPSRTRLREVTGPVAVLAAVTAASDLDELAITVPLDESAEQSRRVCAALRRTAISGPHRAATSTVVTQWRATLAEVPRLPVQVPGADRLVFPDRLLRHRHELRLLLGMVAASALLHHRQREQRDGHLLATDADFQLAIDATRGVLGAAEFSERAQWVLQALRAAPGHTVTLPELHRRRPRWTDGMLRSAMGELVTAGLVIAPPGGRGRRAHAFRLQTGGEGAGLAICLRPASGPGAASDPEQPTGVVA